MKWAILLVFVFFAAACGAPATPDTAALEATITAKVVASLKASAPTGTPAAPPTPALRIPARRSFKHNFQISVDWEPATDLTTVLLQPNAGLLNVVPNQISASFSYKGAKPQVPDQVVLTFWSGTQIQNLYTDVRQVVLTVDGTRQTFDVRHKTDRAELDYLEQMVAFVPTAQFLNIASAQKVQATISDKDFVFTDEQLEALRDLASRMNP